MPEHPGRAHESGAGPPNAATDRLGEPPKHALNAQYGLVAYFDILGFKHVANDTDFVWAGELVTKNLVEAQQRVEEELQRTKVVKPYFTETTQWLVFADSILILSPIPEHDPEAHYYYAFFVICNALLKRMFNEGLPLRGAVSEGRFAVVDRCFIGRAIIDCHALASKTEWSGCVVSEEAREKLKTVLARFEYFKTNMEQVCVEYQVPFVYCSQTQSRRVQLPQLVIKWFHRDPSERSAGCTPGIKASVRKSFQAHKKTLSSKEDSKVENTVQFLRFVDGLYTNSNQKRPIKASSVQKRRPFRFTRSSNKGKILPLP